MAFILKYVENFETLTVGLLYNSPETLKMLFEWADVITVPEEKLLKLIPDKYKSKVKFYNIGPDIYPRPFNKDLFRKINTLMEGDKIL
jgi:hypothetical protein